MKKLMLGIVLCVAMMISVVGCEPPELTPAQVKAFAAEQVVLQGQVDALQEVAAVLANQLVASGIVDKKIIAKVGELSAETDKVQEKITTIALAVEKVPLTDDANLDWVAMLQAANAASSGFNPYAVPVATGLAILNLILGWLARRKAVEAAAAKTETKAVQVKYQAHKQGVEKTMKEVSASTEADIAAVELQLYENIGEARVDLDYKVV